MLKLKKWKRQWWDPKWNRRVATNIHLDHSSPLKKQWSPLRWVPAWDEETSVELGPWWTTCLTARVGHIWLPDTVGSSASKYSWFSCPWYNLWWHVPCNLGLTLLVWVVLQCWKCLAEVGSRAERGPHWILGAYQVMVEYWAQMNFYLQPWWWCMVHIGTGEACIEVQWGAPSANVTTLCCPPRSCVAPDADHVANCT